MDTNIYRYIFSFGIAFLTTFFILPKLISIAFKIGLVDMPNYRKVHSEAKPLAGGIGMAMGLALSALLVMPLFNFRGLYTGLILLVVVGFLDDFEEMGSTSKLIAQIIAATLVVYFSKIQLYTFGDFLSLGEIRTYALSVPITIFCIAGVTNSINMIDGIDGLAGGISLMAFACFAYLAQMCGNTALAVFALSYCGALLAFLRYNYPPSKLFMGDAGSLPLGFSLATFAIALTQGHAACSISPVAPLLVLAIPISDTLLVMLRRALSGQRLFQADRRHIHHILIDMGVEKPLIAWGMTLATLLLGLIAIACTKFGASDFQLFLIFLCFFAIICGVYLANRKLLKGDGQAPSA